MKITLLFILLKKFYLWKTDTNQMAVFLMKIDVHKTKKDILIPFVICIHYTHFPYHFKNYNICCIFSLIFFLSHLAISQSLIPSALCPLASFHLPSLSYIICVYMILSISINYDYFRKVLKISKNIVSEHTWKFHEIFLTIF